MTAPFYSEYHSPLNHCSFYYSRQSSGVSLNYTEQPQVPLLADRRVTTKRREALARHKTRPLASYTPLITNSTVSALKGLEMSRLANPTASTNQQHSPDNVTLELQHHTQKIDSTPQMAYRSNRLSAGSGAFFTLFVKR